MKNVDKHIASVLLDRLADLSGYFKYKELQKQSKKKRGPTDSSSWCKGLYLDWDSKSTLDRCYEFVAENKPSFALVQIIEDIELFMAMVNSISIEELRDDDCIPLRIRSVLGQIYTEYERWTKEEYMPIVNSYKGTHLFRDTEFDEEDNFAPGLFCFVEETIKKELFKSYIYKQGSGRITQATQYYVYPKIGISHSLEDWLNFVEKQDMSAAGDKAVVTLFYKLDYASDHYNYFIITIHHKDSIWLSTDQLSFHNPRNKTATAQRKPEKFKYEHYKYVCLPYELVDELNDLRKKEKGLVKVGGQAITSIPIVESEWKEFADQKWKESEKKGMSHYSTLGRFEWALPMIAEQILSDKKITFSAKASEYRRRGDVEYTFYRHEGKNVALLRKGEGQPEILIYNYPEVLQKDFIDLRTQEKMFFLGLVTRVMEEIGYAPPKEIVTTGHKHLNQLLLTTTEFRYDDNIAIDSSKTGGYNNKYYELNKHRFDGFSKNIQVVFDEIIESLELPKNESKALMLSEFKEVVHSPNYEREWLGVVGALDSNIKWAILEDKAEKLKKQIEETITRERIEADTILLEKMLTKKIDNIYNIAFNEKDKPLNIDVYGSWSDKPINKGKVKTDLFTTENEIRRAKGAFEHWISTIDKSLEDKSKCQGGDINLLYPKPDASIPWYQRKNDKAKCQTCTDNIKLKHWRIHFTISHYKQLMLLLGLTDRMQLPMSYRNYRNYQCIPYKGNSNLDNTHPYSLVDDPMSERHRNGFSISVWICGNCYNKLKEKHTKK